MSLRLAVAAGFLFSAPLFATHTACPATPTPLNTDPFAAPGDGGCFSTNLQFSNFTITNWTTTAPTIFSFNLEPTSPGLAVTLADVAASSPSGVFLRLSPIPPNGPGVGCSSNSGSAGWCINGAGLVLASSVNYQVTTSSGTFSEYGLTVSMAMHVNGNAGSGLPAQATFFREICLGTTVFPTLPDGSADITACGSGNYKVMVWGTLGFSGQTNVYQTGSFSESFAPQTMAAIRDTVFLKTQNGKGSWAAIGVADFVVPEPGTYLILGSALVGLGFARFRRSKGA